MNEVTPGAEFVDTDIRYSGRRLRVVAVAPRAQYHTRRDVAFCVTYGVGGGKGVALDLARLTDPVRFRPADSYVEAVR